MLEVMPATSASPQAFTVLAGVNICGTNHARLGIDAFFHCVTSFPESEDFRKWALRSRRLYAADLRPCEEHVSAALVFELEEVYA